MGSAEPLTKKSSKARFRFHWRRFLLDAASWWAATIIATLIRYEGMMDRANWQNVVYTMLLASGLQLIFGYLLGIYRGRHLWGSFAGFVDVTASAVLTAVLVWIYTVLWPNFAGVPRSLILIAAPFAVIFMAGTRYLGRSVIQYRTKPSETQSPVTFTAQVTLATIWRVC